MASPSHSGYKPTDPTPTKGILDRIIWLQQCADLNNRAILALLENALKQTNGCSCESIRKIVKEELGKLPKPNPTPGGGGGNNQGGNSGGEDFNLTPPPNNLNFTDRDNDFPAVEPTDPNKPPKEGKRVAMIGMQQARRPCCNEYPPDQRIS